jgi:hypothetical protein
MIPLNVRIAPRELQDKFNCGAGCYVKRLGSLRPERTRCGLASPSSGQPAGTKSIMCKYWHGDIPVLYLHWFELPSGEIGASGKKDPKRILVHRVSYFCD